MALEQGGIPAVELLLEFGANPNVTDGYGVTPLMIAAGSGVQKYTAMLIEAKAELDLQDSTGDTALMHAVKAVSYEAVSLLLAAGAELDLQDSTGATALMYAVLAVSYEVVSLLLAAGADKTIRSDRGDTALHWAIRLGPRRGDNISQLLKAPPRTSLDKSQLPNATNPKNSERGIVPGVGDKGMPSQLPLGRTPGELRSESARKLPFR